MNFILFTAREEIRASFLALTKTTNLNATDAYIKKN